jgi:hypothetical protein
MDDRQILQSFLANCYTDIKIAISKDFRITQVRKCYKKVRKVAEGNEKQKPFTQVIVCLFITVLPPPFAPLAPLEPIM